MTDEAIEAAELAARMGSGLSRYSTTAPAPTRLQGSLTQVSTIGAGVMVLLRNVPGLGRNDLCSAVIERATAPLDELLQTIGKDGAMTLVGTATASRETIAVVRMDDVASINGRTLAEIEAEAAKTAAAPITAAELVRRCNAGLERYERLGPTPTVIDGRLKDAHEGGGGSLVMIVDHVDGLKPAAFCMAELRRPTEAAERKLQQIGRSGRIKLTGNATTDQGSLSAVRMLDVEMIDGPETGDTGTDRESNTEGATT